MSHPKYNPGRLENDIALLKLAKFAKFNQYVRSACLPTKDAPIGDDCFVTGYFFK